jgi:hypothetical protein
MSALTSLAASLKTATPQQVQQAMRIGRLPVTNFMPPEGKDFEQTGYITIPAIGASAIVLSFTVPQGFNGVIHRIGNEFDGGAFTPASVLWQILLNAQGFNTATGAVVAPFFNAIAAPLGSVAAPSSIWPGGIRISEAQLVALTVTNVSVTPAGQQIGGRLGGYFYPVDLEDPSIGF